MTVTIIGGGLPILPLRLSKSKSNWRGYKDQLQRHWIPDQVGDDRASRSNGKAVRLRYANPTPAFAGAGSMGGYRDRTCFS